MSVRDSWMSTEHYSNNTDRGNPKYSEKNLFYCHVVHHKSHTDWPVIVPGPPWWEVGDWRNKPWRGGPSNLLTFGVMVTICTTWCNVNKFCILSTKRVYIYHSNLTISSDCPYTAFNSSSKWIHCSLWGTNWIEVRSLGSCFKAVVFNLGDAYPRGYAKKC